MYKYLNLNTQNTQNCKILGILDLGYLSKSVNVHLLTDSTLLISIELLFYIEVRLVEDKYVI